MMTLCIGYKFNPDKLADLTRYFEEEQSVIERCGGKIVGYFLPTDFAGATDEAIGLIDLPSLAAYEDYRKALANDPGHKENIAQLEQSGAQVAMKRSFIRRIAARR
jgi:NIPSNAP